MSLVLAFDTATEDVALALGRFEGDSLTVVGSRDFHAPRAALSRLIPAVRELLSETGAEELSIGTVVVGRGPGSFTGVRIGVATAKGIAQGLGARLLGAGTLDAIAWRFAEAERTVGVVGDAMRGEVYPALFRCGAGTCERLTPDEVADPAEVASRWAESILEQGGPPLLLTGNGLAKHAEAFADTLGELVEFAEPELWAPMGATLLRAAHAAPIGDGTPSALLPVYTRLSDPEEAERLRGVKAGSPLPGNGVAGPGGER